MNVPSKSSTRMKVDFILPLTIGKRFSLLQTIEDIHFGLVRMYVTPYRIFWIIFTSDLLIYRQIVGIPMGTNCAPLVADLFLFCNERDFMTSHSNDNQADIIVSFYSTSRFLHDLLYTDNPYFEGMVNQIYPPELKLNKANTSDTEAHFWIYIYQFLIVLFPPKFMINAMTEFDIVNFPFLDGHVPRRPSYRV